MCRLITIFASLVKLKQFRHEWSSIMYKNTQKRNKSNDVPLLAVTSVSLSIRLLIRHTFCECLVKTCVTKHKWRSFFCDIFSDIGQCFWPAKTNSLENRKSGYVTIIYDKIPYFIKNYPNVQYFTKTGVGCRCVIGPNNHNRQNSRITDKKF